MKYIVLTRWVMANDDNVIQHFTDLRLELYLCMWTNACLRKTTCRVVPIHNSIDFQYVSDLELGGCFIQGIQDKNPECSSRI